MTHDSLFSLAHLRELHAAPKNCFGETMRYASRTQMDEFYALHEAFPALVEVAEAARAVLADSGAAGPWSDLDAALSRFDFGTGE